MTTYVADLYSTCQNIELIEKLKKAAFSQKIDFSPAEMLTEAGGPWVKEGHCVFLVDYQHDSDDDFIDAYDSFTENNPSFISEYLMIFHISISSFEGEQALHMAQLEPSSFNNSCYSFRSFKAIFKECYKRMETFAIHRSLGISSKNMIEFKPEHKQAGLQILNYFQETLNQKYPENEVTVRISQHGNTVTMEIETTEGEKERYEKAFEEFGLTVTGEQPIEEYLPNIVDQMALQHQIRMANLQLENQREILKLKDQVITNIQEDKAYFKSEFLRISGAYTTLSERLADITKLSMQKDDVVDALKLMDTFYQVRGPEHLIIELNNIQKQTPGFFKWIGDRMDKIGSKIATATISKGLLDVLQPYLS